MRYISLCVVSLLLLGGCSNTPAYTQDYTQDYWYAASVEVPQCQMMMTISGGLKQKCSQ